jgi:IS4 transposase
VFCTSNSAAGAYNWLATNLPDRVAAETVGAFHRLRWAVENLFRMLKSVGSARRAALRQARRDPCSSPRRSSAGLSRS